jgi:hypothetical protein
MVISESTPTNQRKIVYARTVLAELLEQALRRGFFGQVGVELKIQDGTIQHVCRKLEQIER